MKVSQYDMISQMQAMSRQAKSMETPAVENGGFKELMSEAVDKVNESLKTSGELKKAFEKGDENVSLVDVMVASQKANISFQAMLNVRNKLINAYQEIMSMQI